MQVRFLLGAVFLFEEMVREMNEGYYDIHCHILPHVDDGSKATDMSRDMLRIARENGIRHIVLTPHYMIGRFELTRDEIYSEYQLFVAKVQDEFPEMEFFFGREIFFGEDISELLENKTISTLNDTDYALIEFHPTAASSYIAQSLYKVENAGYTPILAHIERYPDLFKNVKMIEQIVESGVYIQVNASSVAGRLGNSVKRQIIKLMKKGLVHFVATDAHSNRNRAPYLMECVKYMTKKLGADYVEEILIENPRRMLNNEYF